MNHSTTIPTTKFDFLRKGLMLLAGPFLFSGQVFADTAADRTGALEVFSATQEVQWGEGSFYYPHTGYRISDASGKAVKWVENGSTGIDATPDKVDLAPGSYTIWAQSDRGYVKRHIVIKPGQVAALHLEHTSGFDTETSAIATR